MDTHDQWKQDGGEREEFKEQYKYKSKPMKAQLIDHGGCFEIALTSETMEEASVIALFGINKTTELRGAFSYAHKDHFLASVVIGARKQRTDKITHE